MSTRFLTDPKVEKLGEKHGPVGPLVVVSLLSHAGIQEAGGTVERTFRATAHEVFTDTAKVGEVLDDAVELGLCHAVSRDVQGFVVEFPAWNRHQAAYRKAKSRAASKPAPQANVTGSHAKSQKVTNKTGQDSKEKNVADRDVAPLSHLLADLIVANGSNRPVVGKTWATAERLLLTRDKRNRQEAERLIRWCQASDFWRPNILSMSKFREKYDTLRLQAKSATEPKRDTGLEKLLERAA